MLTDINRNMKHLHVFKSYGIDLFEHMYSYCHINIKRDNFRLIPVEPTEIKYGLHGEGHIFRFKGLSRKKYNYYLISIINFSHAGNYTTVTNKIWTHPISLNHKLYNIQKTYMLVIPKTNTPIQPSNKIDIGYLYLTEPTYIRKQELFNHMHVRNPFLLCTTIADKSGYNVRVYKEQLKYRLFLYKVHKEMLRALNTRVIDNK